MDRQQQQGYAPLNNGPQQQGTGRPNESRQRQGDWQSRQYGEGQARQAGARGFGGRQHAQEDARGQAYGAQQFQSMAEVALRGTALLFDLQMETARNIMRTQARTAALLGAPDYSQFFAAGDGAARRLFAASAEQMLNSARQARETVFEVQRQLGRLAEEQTFGIAEEVRDQIEHMTRHAEEGLEEIKHMAASEADRAQGLVDYALHGEQRQAGPEGSPPQMRAEAPNREAGAPGFEPIARQNGQGNAGEPPTPERENVEPPVNPNEGAGREARERGRARR